MGNTESGRKFEFTRQRCESLRVLVNSCIKELDRIGVRGRKHAVSKINRAIRTKIEIEDSKQEMQHSERVWRQSVRGEELSNKTMRMEPPTRKEYYSILERIQSSQLGRGEKNWRRRLRTPNFLAVLAIDDNRILLFRVAEHHIYNMHIGECYFHDRRVQIIDIKRLGSDDSREWYRKGDKGPHNLPRKTDMNQLQWRVKVQRDKRIVRVDGDGNTTTVVQWNRLRFKGLEIPERTGSNPGRGLNGDWTSTRGKGFQMGGLSGRRSPLGGPL